MKHPLADLLRDFAWSNEPTDWKVSDTLEIQTLPDTDYWQRTHYGFQRDDGHFYYTTLSVDFTKRAAFVAFPVAQYDQCGLMVRVDAENWIKVSTEVEPAGVSCDEPGLLRLGHSGCPCDSDGGVVRDRAIRRRLRAILVTRWTGMAPDAHRPFAPLPGRDSGGRLCLQPEGGGIRLPGG